MVLTSNVIDAGVDLTLTPDTKTILSGESATHTISIENTGSHNDVYDLTATTGVLSSATIAVETGATETFTLTYTAPADGNYTSTVTATSTVDPATTAVSDSVVATTRVYLYDVSVAVTTSPLTVRLSEDVEHTFEITNNGNVPDKYTIEYAGLPAGTLSAATLRVEPGDTGTITFTSEAPAAGLTQLGTLTATSTQAPLLSGAETDNAVATTHVKTFIVTVLDEKDKALSETVTIEAGYIAHTFTVTNAGNDVDTYNIMMTGVGTYSDATLTIAAGETDTFTVNHDSSSAGIYASTVYVTSQGYTGTTETVKAKTFSVEAASHTQFAVTAGVDTYNALQTVGISIDVDASAPVTMDVYKLPANPRPELGESYSHIFGYFTITVTEKASITSATITFPYTEDDVTDYGLDETSISVQYWDESRWKRISSGTIDDELRTLTVDIPSVGWLDRSYEYDFRIGGDEEFFMPPPSPVLPTEEIEDLPSDEAADIVDDLTDDAAADVLENLETDTAAEIIEEIETEQAADIIEAVEVETAVEIIGAVETEQAADIMDSIQVEAAADIVEAAEVADIVEVLDAMDETVAADIVEAVEIETAVEIITEVETEGAADIMEQVEIETAVEIVEAAEVADIVEVLDAMDETVAAEIVEAVEIETAVEIITEVEAEGAADIMEQIDVVAAAEIIEAAEIVDIVDVLEEIEAEAAADIVEEVTLETAVEIITEITVEDAGEIFEEVEVETAVEIIGEIELEDAAGILEEVTTEAVGEIVEVLETEDAAEIINEVDDEKAGEILLEITAEAGAPVVEAMANADINKAAERVESAVKLKIAELDEETQAAFQEKLKDTIENVSVDSLVDLFIEIANLPDTPSTVAEIFEIIGISKTMGVVEGILTQGAYEELALVYSYLSEAKLAEIYTAMTTAARTAIFPYFDAATLGNLPELTTISVSTSVSPSTVESGSSVTVTAEVSNTGDETGDVRVTLKVSGAEVESEIVTLDAGDDTTLTWTVTETTPGTYTVDVNGDTATFTVEALPTPADIETSNLTVTPASIQAGDDVTVTVDVENSGEESGSYTVEVELDGTVEDSETVTLSGGASTTVTFTVTSETEGAHTVEVDSLSDSFTVEEAPAGIPWTTVIIGIVVLAAAAYFYLQSQKTEE